MQLFSSATGSDFLIVYGALLAVSGAAAWAIPAQFRERGRSGETLDAEGAALLAGGPARLAETVMTDLYVRGGLEAPGPGHLVITRRDLVASPAGRALLSLEEPVTLPTARRTLTVHASRLASRLRRGGLLMWPDDHLRLRWLSVSPFLALLLFGLFRLRAASTAHEAPGMLPVLVALTAGLAAFRFFWTDPRTRAGVAALENLRARYGRSVGGANSEDIAMAVALHGTKVLASTPWAALHALRQPGDSGGAEGDWVGGEAACTAASGDGGGCGD